MSAGLGAFPAMERDELSAWLRLLETPQVGRGSARKLLAAFGSPHAVLAAPTAARRELVSAETAAALAEVPDAVTALVDATIQWLSDAQEGSPRQVLTPRSLPWPFW